MRLADTGMAISLYGNQWEKWIKVKSHQDIQFRGTIYKEHFNKELSPYRLHLNIFRPHNYDSHNMRTFEIPGMGGIMLAPESKEHRLLFKHGKEVMLYNDFAELTKMAQEILGLPYKKALMMRKNAYKRSIESNYTYKARANEVLGHFERLINGRK
jgi:spore maturation protein CgeB